MLLNCVIRHPSYGWMLNDRYISGMIMDIKTQKSNESAHVCGNKTFKIDTFVLYTLNSPDNVCAYHIRHSQLETEFKIWKIELLYLLYNTNVPGSYVMKIYSTPYGTITCHYK